MPATKHSTREAWLRELTERFRPWFAEAGFELLEQIATSCSWPTRGATASKRRVLGQAFSSSSSAAGIHETVVSPALDDPLEVAAVLLHELVHHAAGIAAGHGPKFRRCALAIGLVGPMRSTRLGDDLKERVNAILRELGPYPHARLLPKPHRTQSTRMLKVECEACGCIARMTRRWLEAVGAPTCACGHQMTVSPISPKGSRGLAPNEAAQSKGQT